jgi:staphylococcal nuclease domain-containing protein 1
MFEAREFLRKKLITKKVNVLVDYIQPKSVEFPEKIGCTVTINEVNVAEALVSKGLATVIRYRQGDDQRSSCYDDLLKSEDRAEKKAVGVHSKKDQPMIRVADVAGDVAKAKQFFPFLQRAGKAEALVEFVASGSRLRLYIPKETCLITFLLSGIECPHGSRQGPNGSTVPADPFGDEAHAFTKELVMQREVEVEVESMDKGGNFIGWLYVDGLGLSTSLVEEGLAKVHFTAERGNHFKQLQAAEAKAKAANKALWTLHEEPKEEVVEAEVLDRKVNYQTVIITEITKELHLFAQNAETGPSLVTLMEQLRSELSANPPLTGAYAPKKGDLCAAKFTDGEWYRARVDRVTGNKVSVTYIDYGNKEETSVTRLATLELTYQSLPAQAHEYALACIALPKDEDDVLNAMDALSAEISSKQYELNVEYRAGGVDYATLQFPVGGGEAVKEDVAQNLVSEGLVLVEARKEKRLAKLIGQYKKAEEKAKEARKNLWRYGDFTEDDSKEFGYKP